MLIEKILQNRNLIFKDLETKQEKYFCDFDLNSFQFENYSKSLVFLYLDNSLKSVETFFGVFSSKHTIVLLSLELSEVLKENLENDYKPKIIYDTKRGSINNYFFENGFFISEIEQTQYISPEIKLLLSTSGTTGSSKFVKLSEDNLCSNAVSIIKYLPINRSDVCPLNLPLNYSYGLSILTTNALAGGTIVCGLKDILNKDFWNDFEENGFTSLAGVPYVYEILNRIGFLKKRYSSLKYLTQAGGKLNEKLISLFAEYSKNNSLDFFVMYGQTEATARMSYLHVNEFPNKIGSVGRSIDLGKFDIDHESNELIFDGPNVFGGYAECLDDLNHYVKNPLFTGDLARMDDDGFVYIIGRSKRFIKILGSRINLDELENNLKEYFQNNTFICIGKEDTSLQIACTNSTIEKKEVCNFIKDLFNIHPAYIKFKIIETIPLTANGKINYNAILE